VKRKTKQGGYWFPVSVTTEYEGGIPLLNEIVRMIKSGKLDRSQVITFRVPQGAMKVTVPCGITIEAWHSIFAGAFETIATRLRQRKIEVELIKENFELTENRDGVSFAELRRIAQKKMSSKKNFKRRVKTMRATANEGQLVLDRADRFTVENWVACVRDGSPGLRTMKPKQAFELMKAAGVLRRERQDYDSAWVLWYKQRRRRLGRKLT
jgi:hypothetical protein